MAPDSTIMPIRERYRDLDIGLSRASHQILAEIKAVDMICVAIERHQVDNIHFKITKILSGLVPLTLASLPTAI